MMDSTAHACDSGRRPAYSPASDDRERDRALLDSLPCVVYEATEERTTWISESVERLTGWPAATWLDEHHFWLSIVHPDDRAPTLRALAESRLCGRFRAEYRLRHRDGSYRWFRDEATTLVGPTGYAMRGVLFDVTEEHRSRQRQRAYADLLVAPTRSLELEEVLRHIVEAAVDLLDAHTAALFLPDEEAHGLRRAAHAGELISRLDLLPLGDERHLCARAFRTGAPQISDDYLEEGRDYAALSVDADVGPLAAFPVLAGGRSIAVLGIARRRGQPVFGYACRSDAGLLCTQAALAITHARLYTEARTSSAAKTALLSTMSHELRTPLNAIEGFLSLLDMEVAGPLTPMQRDYVGRARRAGTHLLRIIEDILDLSRAEHGRLRVTARSFDALEPAAQAVELIRPQIRRAAVVLHQPEGEPGVLALGDPDRLRQILLNLLKNAVKFTESGTIRVEVAQDAAAVRWAVHDTGSGIAPAELARVFEPFYQVDNRLTRTNDGAGLGLAVSRALARAMGGELVADSTPGVGSSFVLSLPRA